MLLVGDMASLRRRRDDAGLQRFKMTEPLVRKRRRVRRKFTNVKGQGSQLLADLIVQFT